MISFMVTRMKLYHFAQLVPMKCQQSVTNPALFIQKIQYCCNVETLTETPTEANKIYHSYFSSAFGLSFVGKPNA